MNLYSVLLVDDEEEIRNGMRKKIDWQSLGFKLVECAENGQDALELAKNLHPDVVLTDIKMPFMDGLTLCSHLNKLYPLTKLVIFTGFDDFEYAQKAIKENVFEYILKPIDSDELTEVLKRLYNQLNSEIEEKQNIEKLRRYYDESLPVLKEQFLSELLQGRLLAEDIEERLKRYDMHLEGSYWAAVVLRCYRMSSEPENSVNMFNSQTELIPLSIKQRVDENLNRACRFKSLIMSDGVAVIAVFDEKNQVTTLIHTLNQICQIIYRYHQLAVSAGIGNVCDRLDALHSSYQGALSALDYRVMVGLNKSIYIEDIEPAASGQPLFDELNIQELLSAIKLGIPQNIENEVNRLKATLSGLNISLGEYQICLMQILSELIKLVYAYKLNPNEILGKDFNNWFDLSRFNCIDALINWLYGTSVKISSQIRTERTNSNKVLTDMAKAFIDQNFANSDLSLEMLCDHLHISSAYFSTIFKKVTGMSFVEYLTNVRMEQAVKLLNTTEKKAYEISLDIGYTEPNYFSYVFKKQFGVSPTKYKSIKEENNG